MATRVVKTIKSSGGDYATLQAFAAGEARNLVTADQIAVAQCYTFSDTTQVTSFTAVAGWVTDTTRYISIEVVDDHAGIRDTVTPSTYYLNVTAAGAGSFQMDSGLHILWTGGQISNWGSGNSDIFLVAGATATGFLTLNKVLGIGGGRCFVYSAGTMPVNILRSFCRVAGPSVQSNGGTKIYSSCLSNATGNGHFANASVIKNTYIHSVSGTCFPGGLGVTEVTCASSDASSATVTLRSIAYDNTKFVNAAGNADMHLVSGNAMINAGTDTSADSAPMNFTLDVDGYVFGGDGNWDVGYSEYGGSPPAPGGSNHTMFILGF